MKIDMQQWTYARLTDVRRIPERWRLVTLIEEAKLESGHTPDRDIPAYWQGDIPWLSLHDTKQLDSHVVVDTRLHVSELGIANSSARLLPAGTVALSRTATVGKCVILGRSMATSQDFACYICGPRVHNKYLMHLFRYMQPVWRSLAGGSTHQTVYMPVFKRLEVLLPTLEEQRKIAEILDTVDESIRSTERLITKLGDTRVGTLASLISTIDEEFFQPLDRGITRIEAGKSPDAPDRPAGNDEWGVLKVSAVRPWGLDEVENKIITRPAAVDARYEVRAGDLLITRANTPQLVGLACYVNTTRPRLLLSDKTLRLIVSYEVANPRYLSYVLGSHDARRQIETCGTGSSGSMKNISQQEIRAIRIPLPDIAAQDCIVEIVESAERTIARERDELVKLRGVKQGLMEDLLTGRVRVKMG